MPRLNRIRQARYLPPLVLLLWGWLLVWSSVSARLDLLLNAVFHPVVAIAGVVLMVLGAIQLRSAPRLKTPSNSFELAGFGCGGLVGFAVSPSTFFQ